MKIAFTATGCTWDSPMDPRFGRTAYILVFDEETEVFTSFDNKAIGDVAHGAGPQTSKALFDLEPDILLTGNGPGGNAATVLKESTIKIFVGAGSMTVKEAYEAYKANKLSSI